MGWEPRLVSFPGKPVSPRLQTLCRPPAGLLSTLRPDWQGRLRTLPWLGTPATQAFLLLLGLVNVTPTSGPSACSPLCVERSPPISPWLLFFYFQVSAEMSLPPQKGHADVSPTPSHFVTTHLNFLHRIIHWSHPA